MTTSGAEAIASLLEPLLQALRASRDLRLVARPGLVIGDRPGASEPLGVAWEAAAHERAVTSITASTVLADGVTATVVGGSVVLCRPPDPRRRVEDLVQDGRVSILAGRLLSASVGMGHNVLVAAPWCVAVELIAALLAEGQRPGVVTGSPADAVPATWARLDAPAAAALYGADRIGAWSIDAERAVALLGKVSGAAVFIDARRLDRALIRLEAGAERNFHGSGNTAMSILAAVDLVVVADGSARVREIAQITLAEDGYRPRLLFASGLPPVVSALVPVAAPTYLEELAKSGHQVLADELAHATPEVAGPEPRPARAKSPPSTPAPRLAPAVAELPPPGAPPAPRFDPALADAPPPGWELDRLAEDGEAALSPAAQNVEDATLAAAFGLAPPPPPPGVTAASVEAMSTGPNGATFAEALKRAKEREAEVAAADEDDERES
ncbi:MAG: hypothetical protein HY903_06145 [Deltaproteobacteria bacterium]|nr:hypothetical protein [Deltaproteobacteria bacterium]